MRKRTWLRLGYVTFLVLALLFFRAASKHGPEGPFYVNLDDTRAIVTARLGGPDTQDPESGEMVWLRDCFLVRFELRVLFDADDLPRRVLELRRIGMSWAGWTLVRHDSRRNCVDFCPERGCL